MPPTVAGNAPLIDLAMLPPADVLQGILEQAANLGLRLTLEGVEVLAMPPQPGAEPLRKEHLHTALQRLAEQQFVPSLALHLIHVAVGRSPLC